MGSSWNDDVLAAPPAALEPASDAARTLAFRRSLRASRARRATAMLRRRRLLCSRGSALAAMAGLFVLSAGALAQDGGSPQPAPQLSSETIAAVQRALGVSADGVAGPRTKRKVRRFQRRYGLTVDGLIGPQTLKALGIDGAAQHARDAAAPDPVLARIAQCESGGDPRAVSASGQYRGKYQFDLATWQEIGGTGDPAAAPESEQDARAARLLKRKGTAPWPTCG